MIEHVQPGPARFDGALQAWILSSHEDVSAALRETRLATVASAGSEAVHLLVRDAMAHALSPDRLATWRLAFEADARERAATLPSDRPVDLLASFAAPWALAVAITVTGAPAADATELAALARAVFLRAINGDPGATCEQAAAAELARRLPAAEASMNVQTFVALSQTLPHLLVAAWRELFGDPETAARLRSEPHRVPQAVEELLRLGGPARAVFRQAVADAPIGDASILAGDRVVLMLAAANHDPAHFPHPERLDLERALRDHLSFGGGAHACAGARLVRMAAAVATSALLRATSAIELVEPMTWIDGLAIRAPASLPAVLRRDAAAVREL